MQDAHLNFPLLPKAEFVENFTIHVNQDGSESKVDRVTRFSPFATEFESPKSLNLVTLYERIALNLSWPSVRKCLKRPFASRSKESGTKLTLQITLEMIQPSYIGKFLKIFACKVHLFCMFQEQYREKYNVRVRFTARKRVYYKNVKIWNHHLFYSKVNAKKKLNFQNILFKNQNFW